MTYGLLAALSWGVAILAGAMAARRIGPFRTTLIGEATGLTGYGLVFLLGHFSLRGAAGPAWVLMAAGAIGVFGYLAFYRGLESGHVGLVSAVSATYGGVTVLLSVLLLGERLTFLADCGIAATLAGVMLAVWRRTPAGVAAAPATGLAFGMISAICYGGVAFVIGRYTRTLGWLVPVVIARSGALALLLGLLVTPLRRPAGGSRPFGLAWAMAAGLADAAGLLFFARGDQVGLVSITAAVSSAYPVVPLIGGLLLFRERLLRSQAGGAALIMAGLILLGMGS